MNKFLASSLIATGLLAITNVSSETCSSGGFYMGVNAGLAFSKVKTSTSPYRYKTGDVIPGTEVNVQENSGSVVDDVRERAITAVSESIAKTHKVRKRKTSFLAEIVVGYDHRLNDVMMGVDLAFGKTCGRQNVKSKKASGTIQDRKASTVNPQRAFAKIEEKWHISFMPRVGYLFTPDLEGFITAGIKWRKMKYITYKHGYKYLDGRTYTEKHDNFKGDSQDVYKAKTKKSSMNMIPVVGLGIRYNVTSSLYTKFEYNYEFPKRIKMPKDGIIECNRVNIETHIIKLGLGYKF